MRLKFQDRATRGRKKQQTFRYNSHRVVRGPGGAWIPGYRSFSTVNFRPLIFGPDLWRLVRFLSRLVGYFNQNTSIYSQTLAKNVGPFVTFSSHVTSFVTPIVTFDRRLSLFNGEGILI